VNEEYNDLLFLADALDVNIHPNTLNNISEESLLVENELEKLSLHIRNEYLTQCFKKTHFFFKSPYKLNYDYHENITNLDFVYERNLNSKGIETYYEESFLKLQAEQYSSLLFSSGISSIYTVINSLLGFIKSSTRINILFLGGYFENHTIIDSIKNRNVNVDYSITPNRDYHIIFIEPTKYSWNLDENHYEAIAPILTNKYLQAIIVDSTLENGNLILNKLLHKKTNSLLVFEVKSLLKLEQFGLEFCNLGLCNIISSLESTTHESIVDYIRKIRTVNGTGISLMTKTILSNQVFSNREYINSYKNKILTNNRILREQIKKQNIITHISNTNKSGNPFTIIEFKNRNLIDCGIVMGWFEYLSNSEQITLYKGSSFGFRHHRYETIIPDRYKREGYLKIAAGSRLGTSFFKLLSIIQKLTEYENSNQILSEYPMIKIEQFNDLD
jgi:hypothetical protein